MKLGFKRGQKGFTLVELMVVMAIMAVLASIVVPAVTGTKQTSTDTQVKQDAGAVQTAVGSFNADSNLAENLATDAGATVLGESLSGAKVEVTSSRWPEVSVTAKYGTEFPATVGLAVNTVSAVTIKDKDGIVLYGTGQSTGKGLADFVANYNVINIDTLVTMGYSQQEPNGCDVTFSTTKVYHNYLWLLKKVAVGDDADGGRVVEVFSLTIVDTATADALTYERIF